MRLIPRIGSLREWLSEAVKKQIVADYVYTYPPIQSYLPIDPDGLDSVINASLAKSNSINLYFHVPHCRQLCSYCNLFTTPTKAYPISSYVALLVRELEYFYAQQLLNKTVSTIYIGGGTPSLASPESIGNLLQSIETLCHFPLDGISEIAIEIDPQTVDGSKLDDFHAIGINRINLGVQTLNPDELSGINRLRITRTLLDVIDQSLSVGFGNVCIDLIYGLRGQSQDSWRHSVATVASLAPHTICVYPLTLRTRTIYSAKGYQEVNDAEQISKARIAHDILLANGYRRETHVRYKKEGGGYVQKSNHWRLENVLGIGAGARSYLWEADFRNGYSTTRRNSVVRTYATKVSSHCFPADSGFLMSTAERKHKAIILGLHDLDRGWYESLFGTDATEDFNKEFRVLEELGLITVSPERIWLTEEGYFARDLIVQAFFTDSVVERISAYTYND